MSHVRRAGLLVIAIACLALFAVACGDDDDESQPSGGGGDTSADTSDDQSGGAGEKSVTDYVEYIGGKAGKADPNKSTIYIGWLNQQGGQQEIGAAATDGADLAVKVANEQLGGIDGHPVALKKCFIKNAEEEGTTCGQKLGNDKDVVAINVGGVAIGIQPFYSTIGGKKPVVVGVAVTPVDGVQDNATVLFGDATHVLGPFGTYAKDKLGAKTAALVYPNIAGITDGAAALDKGLKAAGVEVKKVGYAQGQTDLIGPLTAAGAQNADIVIPYSDASGCVNQAKALKQLGITDAKKIVSAPLCLNPTVSEGLGGDYPIWTYAIASSLYGDKTDPGMARLHQGDRAVRREDGAGPVGDRVVRERADDDQVPQRGRRRQPRRRTRSSRRRGRSPARWPSARRSSSARSTRTPRRSATTGPSSSPIRGRISSTRRPSGCNRPGDPGLPPTR